MRNWLARLGNRLLPSAPRDDETVVEELARIQESQERLTEALGEIRQRLSTELDAIKTAQNYLYRELSSELDELREEVQTKSHEGISPVEMHDIATSDGLKHVKSYGHVQEPAVVDGDQVGTVL